MADDPAQQLLSDSHVAKGGKSGVLIAVPARPLENKRLRASDTPEPLIEGPKPSPAPAPRYYVAVVGEKPEPHSLPELVDAMRERQRRMLGDLKYFNELDHKNAPAASSALKVLLSKFSGIIEAAKLEGADFKSCRARLARIGVESLERIPERQKPERYRTFAVKFAGLSPEWQTVNAPAAKKVWEARGADPEIGAMPLAYQQMSALAAVGESLSGDATSEGRQLPPPPPERREPRGGMEI